MGQVLGPVTMDRRWLVGWSHADCNNIVDDDDYGQPGWDNVLINSVTVVLDIVV